MAAKLKLQTFLWLLVAFLAVSISLDGTTAQTVTISESSPTQEPTNAGDFTISESSPTKAPTSASDFTISESSPTKATTNANDFTKSESSPTKATTNANGFTKSESFPTKATTNANDFTKSESFPTVATTNTSDFMTSEPSSEAATDIISPSTKTVPTTAAPGPCDMGLCGQGSTCEDRGSQTYVCLCLPGENYNYNSRSCENAKVFPGNLNMPGLIFHKNMGIIGSPEFNMAAQNISAEISTLFQETDGFSNVTVLKLQRNVQAKVDSEKGVSASVELTFQPNSQITAEDIDERIVNASQCENCLLANSSFQNTSLCDKRPCDNTTTKCDSRDGSYDCVCQEHYIKTNFSDRICIACPSGQEAVDSLRCDDCPFGYSGLNCSENWKLVLVIVGSVLGGLLLISLLLLPIVGCKSSKKKSQRSKNVDVGKPYVSHSAAKSPLVNANSPATSLDVSGFGSGGVTKIPRATATNSWDSRTNLEMVPSNSQQNLIRGNSRHYDDRDDMNPYSQSRPQSSPATRPWNQPYAQNRPRVNPYAQSQGHDNPYYTHDNGRYAN